MSKPEDGLVHDWDREDQTEWHAATDPQFAASTFGSIALVLAVAGAIIALVFGTPSTPIVIPVLLAAAVLWTVSYTIGRGR